MTLKTNQEGGDCFVEVCTVKTSPLKDYKYVLLVFGFGHFTMSFGLESHGLNGSILSTQDHKLQSVCGAIFSLFHVPGVADCGS